MAAKIGTVPHERLRDSYHSPLTTPMHRWSLFAILLLTVVIRGGVIVLTPGALTEDPDAYRELAHNVLEHGVLGQGRVPSAYRPPLYPLLLVPCYALGDAAGRWAVGVLHVAMGVATVGLVWWLGRRAGLGLAAAGAAVLVACDPILLVQSAEVMTETPATLLAVAALAAQVHAAGRPSPARGLVAGAVLGLAVLCRPTFLPWAAVSVVALAWLRRGRPGGLAAALAAAGALVLVLLPWVVRNQVHFGKPIATTTHGGYTVYLGNNPSFYEHLRRGPRDRVWEAEAFDAAWSRRAPRRTPAEELAADRLAYAKAWESARREPAMFVYSSLVRVAWLWRPLPHQLAPDEGPLRRTGRLIVAAWYLAVYAAAVVAVVRLRRRRGAFRRRRLMLWLCGGLLLATVTAVHSVYWSNMRMRAPLMPVVALAAAAACTVTYPTRPTRS